jgi:hypothetical protein
VHVLLHSSVEVSTCVAASLVLSRGLVRAISVERRTMGTLVMRLCDQPENGPCHVNNFGSCRVRKIEPFFYVVPWISILDCLRVRAR